jgi:hypothetical protein
MHQPVEQLRQQQQQQQQPSLMHIPLYVFHETAIKSSKTSISISLVAGDNNPSIVCI